MCSVQKEHHCQKIILLQNSGPPELDLQCTRSLVTPSRLCASQCCQTAFCWSFVSSGALLHPNRSYRNREVQHNASVCSKATQHIQVVSLELNFQLLGCSNIHLLVRGILQSRIPHLLLTVCLLEIGVFQTVS